MTGSTPVALRPRSATEIIDTAVLLARRDYPALVALAALQMILMYPLRALLITPLAGHARPLVITFAFLLLRIASATVPMALIAPRVLRAMIGEKHANESRAHLRDFPAFLGTTLVASIAVLVGFVLVIVPGIIVSAQLCLVTMVALFEKKSFAAAFRRSESLTSGQRVKYFQSVLVPVYAYDVAVTLMYRWFKPWMPSITGREMLFSFIGVTVRPFIVALAVVAYVDARIVREGFDLEIASGSAAASPPPAQEPALS